MEGTSTATVSLPVLHKDVDVTHVILLHLYYVCLGFVWFYSFSRWKNLAASVWRHYVAQTAVHPETYDDKEDEEQIPLSFDDTTDDKTRIPAVTVQICSYNEGSVIEETISRACALRWPRNKLTVHVLDDSTEKDSMEIVNDCVMRQKQLGVNVHRLTRPNRIGYKAGNLSYHLQAVESDYVLYLDGDHRVEPDFLQRMIPHFFDPLLSTPRKNIGLVQAPWGFYNSHVNLLTECDALGLDIHHVVEQPSRAYLHKVFGFNGTGGIWRKQAIIDAGGWTSDTVTEDLSISYLAFLAGYDFVYVVDCPQQLELPSNLLAHIQQKQRWTKGFLQVFRMYFWRILTSRRASAFVKLEAFMHLTGGLQLFFAVLCITLYPHLVFHEIHTPLIEALSVFTIAEPICSCVHAILTKTATREGTFGSDHTRFVRMIYIIPYFILRFGMAPFEVRSMLEGLFSNDATFLTTPKEGNPKNNIQSTTTAKPKIKSFWADDLTASMGMFLGCHQLVYILMFDRYFDNARYGDWLVRIMNILICLGLVIVASTFLLAKHMHFFEKIRGGTRRLKKAIRLCTLILLWLSISKMSFVHIVMPLETNAPFSEQDAVSFRKAPSAAALPNVLMIGAQKAGTSALALWMYQEGVCAAKTFDNEPEWYNKEVHFFDHDDRFENGINFYIKRFEHCETTNSTFAMDATPNTLGFPSRVHDVYKSVGEQALKNLKLILLVRDPVARELSLYNHMSASYRDNPDRMAWYAKIARSDGSVMEFNEYADRVLLTLSKNEIKRNFGSYGDHVQEWLKYFDRKQLLVLGYDEMKDAPRRTQWRIRTFLKSDQILTADGDIPISNSQSSSNKIHQMTCATQVKLTSMYQNSSQAFYDILRNTPGRPSMEEFPFPPFKSAPCLPNKPSM